MEIWDLYDVNRVKIGEHVRGTVLPENGYHLVVHVWIRNCAGMYLMTQRAAYKSHPLKWECVGGSVLQGEDSLSGAVREVAEETGIYLDRKEGKLLFTKVRGTVEEKRYNDIVDVWSFVYDGQVDIEKASTKEVAQARWMTREEIMEMYREGKLVDSIKDLRYFFDEMA